jgi:hypothetical protein
MVPEGSMDFCGAMFVRILRPDSNGSFDFNRSAFSYCSEVSAAS